MSYPHELAEEFPDKVSVMHDLKPSDAYREINRQVHRAETNVEPIEDLAEGELRKKRATLRDEIWSILSKASA